MQSTAEGIFIMAAICCVETFCCFHPHGGRGTCAEEDGGEGPPAREAELQAAAQEARERGRYIDRFRRGFHGLTAAGPRPAAAPLRLPPRSNVNPSSSTPLLSDCNCATATTSVIHHHRHLHLRDQQPVSRVVLQCAQHAWPLLRFQPDVSTCDMKCRAPV